MLGFIDLLVSAGYFEGWAYDNEAPFEPAHVAILDREGTEVACGLAHLFREDLVAAKFGTGWCAFRLRTTYSVSSLRKTSFNLIDKKSGGIIHSVDKISYGESSDRLLNNVADVVKIDPTCIESIDQLKGCQPNFDDFIKLRGVDAFVRTAYVYVLGRPADVEGLSLYRRLIRQGLVSPFAMIETLANSTEFRSRPRSLVAPNMVGFPFVCG